jgi:N-methylhydantoinase B
VRAPVSAAAPLRYQGAVDQVLLTLLNARLQQVVDEMDAMLAACGATGGGHALVDPATAAVLWQSRTVQPVTVGAMAAGARRAIGREKVEPALIRPYLHDGDTVCFLASENEGAIDARLAALAHGASRLERLIETHGSAETRRGIAALIARMADAAGDIVAGMSDGRWSADDWLDDDGIEDRPLKIALDLKICGDAMMLDFSRSAAAAGGPMAIARETTIAACHTALGKVFGDLPPAALTPLHFVIPEGCVLAGTQRGSHAALMQTVLRVAEVVLAALAAATPDSAQAPGLGTMSALSLSGREGAMSGAFGGGQGASVEGDGANFGALPMAPLPSAELLEATHPLLVATYALRPDSGGAGRYRGGLGAVYELELRTPQGEASVVSDRGKYGPPGVRGGRPGATTRILWWDGGVQCDPPLVSKLDGLKLVQGQRLRLETPGGGGYGRARERDPAAVADDVRLGYVTARAAEREYAVVVSADGVLDVEATQKLRGG